MRNERSGLVEMRSRHLAHCDVWDGDGESFDCDLTLKRRNNTKQK